MTKKQMLLCTDIETSGLDLETDQILEVAFVLTDTDFNEISHYEAVIAPRGGGPLSESVHDLFLKSHEVVQRMHTDNGLWQDLATAGLPRGTVAQGAARWLASVVEPLSDTEEFSSAPPIMAGASIHALDWPMLQRDFKQLCAMLSHRVLDVSTLKRAGEWWLDGPAPHMSLAPLPDMAAHRAMSDCRFTIAEAKAYQEFFRARQAS